MAEAWFFAVNLLYVAAAAAVVFAVARVADNVLGVEFKTEVLPSINSNSVGAGLYYGLRWFGICWLVSQAIS